MLSSQELAEYLLHLKEYLFKSKSDYLYQAIADSPFTQKFYAVQLDLGIIALLILDSDSGIIYRTAMSDTELAHSADAVSAKPFHEMNIPVRHASNIIAKSIRTGKQYHTSDWKDLFVPVLKASEARFNQAAGGIGSSIVSPIITPTTKGAMVFDFYQPIENIKNIHQKFVDDYTNLARELLQKRAADLRS